MVQSMLHESRYETGTCEAPEMGVYAGWVAHPGSFAAMESGGDAAGATDLVFAGECFQDSNDINATPLTSIRQDRSGGSLLRLYDRFGEDWVAELNGLFSGLLIDRRRGRAWLFNDRYGLEHIYVHETHEATYFASEAKALLRVLPTLRTFDDDAVAEFLAFGYSLEGKTLFRGIKSLEAGSLWTFGGRLPQKGRYFDPARWECQPVCTPRP